MERAGITSEPDTSPTKNGTFSGPATVSPAVPALYSVSYTTRANWYVTRPIEQAGNASMATTDLQPTDPEGAKSRFWPLDEAVERRVGGDAPGCRVVVVVVDQRFP